MKLGGASGRIFELKACAQRSNSAHNQRSPTDVEDDAGSAQRLNSLNARNLNNNLIDAVDKSQEDDAAKVVSSKNESDVLKLDDNS